MSIVIRAVLIGMAIVMAGTIPRNIIFAANLRYFSKFPWAVPVTGVYLWFFWQYLTGAWGAGDTAEERRTSLRANPVSVSGWVWALLAGWLGVAALVVALRLANRIVVLPQQQLPDLKDVPQLTMVSLLMMSAPVAGIIEEAAFRGYMQRPIERRYGLPIAILITGTMFGVAHLDFTVILWPYYVAVAAIYGTVTFLTDSILPAIVLHTTGNLYSNFDLFWHGQAEWQAPPGAAPLIWTTGADTAFWTSIAALIALLIVMAWAYARLAAAARANRPGAASTR